MNTKNNTMKLLSIANRTSRFFRILFILFAVFNLVVIAKSQTTKSNILPRFFPSKKQPKAFGSFKFWENKGQWDENVLFRSELNRGTVYLEKDHLTYFFLDQKQFADRFGHINRGSKRGAGQSAGMEQPISGHAYRINFKKANENTIVEGFEKKRSYSTFF